MAGRVLVTPPASEPVSLADAKLFARITTSAEDALVTTLITAARQRCENWRGFSFVTQTWDFFFDRFPNRRDGWLQSENFTPSGAQFGRGYPTAYDLRERAISLERGPCQSVTFVKYTPLNGSPVTLDPASYIVDTSNTLAPRIMPNLDKMWPPDLLQSMNAVNVRAIMGYATVPESINLAIKQLVSFLYYNRDAGNVLPESVTELLAEETGGFTYA